MSAAQSERAPAEPAARPRGDAESARTLLAAAVVALLLGTGAALRAVDLLVAVALVQGLLVVSWVLTFRPPVLDPSVGPELGVRARRFPGAVPGRIGAVLLTGAAAAGADVAVSVHPHAALSPLLIVVALIVPLMFAHQLTRGVVRVRVVESLSGIAVLVVSAVALTALIQLRHEDDGARRAVVAVVAAGTAVVVGHVVDLIWARPRFDPQVPRGLTAVVVATVAGAAAGLVALRSAALLSTAQTILFTAVIALVAAVAAVATGMIAHGLAALDPDPAAGTTVDAPADSTVSPSAEPALGPGSGLRPVAVAIVPLALVAPIAYLLLLAR